MTKRLLLILLSSAFIFSLLSIKNNKHYALLQKNVGYWGIQYTGDGSIYNFDYIEENNELIMSEIGRIDWDYIEGETYYDLEYYYNVEHDITTDSTGTTYIYSVFDASQTLYSRTTYTLNNQNKLINYKNNNLLEQKLYYNTSGALDSIYYSWYYYPRYNKYKFTHDALNRISNVQIYNSSDSLNWVHSYTNTIYYGDPLPVSLNFDTPETGDVALFGYLFNPDYKIDSLVVFNVQYNYNNSYYYSYNNYGTIVFHGNSGGVSFQFNTLGCLVNYSYSITPNGYSTAYCLVLL